jgi:hypothetical protein
MSFSTEPAFVVFAKGWDINLLAHPMMKFLHEHEQLFDAKKFEECRPYYADNIVYIKGNGTVVSGPGTVDTMEGDYALFKEHFRK